MTVRRRERSRHSVLPDLKESFSPRRLEFAPAQDSGGVSGGVSGIMGM
jgi:hypothetical protein